MFYKIFLSPQVKRWTITTYKHGIYELPHDLPNDLRPHGIFAAGGGLGAHTRKKKKRLRILGNQEISRQCLNPIE